MIFRKFCWLKLAIIYKLYIYILVTKTTAAQNEGALSYHRLCGLYFLAVVFVAAVISFREAFSRAVLYMYNVYRIYYVIMCNAPAPKFNNCLINFV